MVLAALTIAGGGAIVLFLSESEGEVGEIVRPKAGEGEVEGDSDRPVSILATISSK